MLFCISLDSLELTDLDMHNHEFDDVMCQLSVAMEIVCANLS